MRRQLGNNLSYRIARAFLALPVLLVLISCPSDESHVSNPDFANLPAYKVNRVIDGDTVELLKDGKKTRVRLIGIDTPESVHPSNPVEAFGREASAFTKSLLSGREVWSIADPEGDTIDQYGRTLAHLYRVPDGLWINYEIVRQGYGHVYTRARFKYRELFRSAERNARQNRLGLWGGDRPATASTSHR